MDSVYPGYGEIEYHSSLSNGNQSTSSTKTDESSQGMDFIPKPTDNQTLQHADHPKNITLSKEHHKLNVSLQNTGANYPHGSSTGKRPMPRPKPLPDKQLVQSNANPASSSPIWLIWPRKTWNILSDEIIHAFRRKELPKGINQNCFSWRSVTRSETDSPSPGYRQKEYRTGYAATVNQSNASNEKDCYRPPDGIFLENQNETLEHGDDRNEEIEYHSGSSNGNQRNASMTTEQLHQQRNHIIPHAALPSENDHKILQHGNGPNADQREYHNSMSDGSQVTDSIKTDESGQGMDLISNPTDNGTRRDEDHRNKCEDPAKHLRPTPEDVPKEKVTENSGIPANSKPSITDNTAIAKINGSKQMPHVSFVMRMSKDHEWNRLPEHISSENEEKTMSPNVTDNQNRKISIKSQNNPIERKIEHAWSLFADNPSRVKNECRWLKKSGNASCMDNEDYVLDFLENETLSSTAKTKSSDKVNSTENNGTELENQLDTNQLDRSHGSLSAVTEKSRDAMASLKVLDSVFQESGIKAHMLTNWSWQDTFDVLIISWMINFCLADLYLTGCFIKEIIGLLRLQRQRQQEEERERLRELKPWRPKPKKKRRKKKNDW